MTFVIFNNYVSEKNVIRLIPYSIKSAQFRDFPKVFIKTKYIQRIKY